MVLPVVLVALLLGARLDLDVRLIWCLDVVSGLCLRQVL